MRVLVTGATGYVGSRVVPRLVADGHDVVVLTRDRARAHARPWADDVTVAEGDVTDAKAATAALAGVDTALYLVHGLVTGADFAAVEARGARTFADSASLVGVEHVIYLGGLADDSDPRLSRHLASRLETGRLLADGGPPTTELRASIVLGAGSSSFELIRFTARSAPVLPRLGGPHRRGGRDGGPPRSPRLRLIAARRVDSAGRTPTTPARLEA